MHIAILPLVHRYGYIGLFFMMATEMLGAPFPAETTLTVCGFAWGQGAFSFVPLFLAGSVGNIVGSTLSYGLGRGPGYRLVRRYGRFVRLTEERMSKAERAFGKRRKLAVFVFKFVSILRLAVPLLAGVSKMNFALFTLVNATSAFLFAAIYLLEGRYLDVLWKQYGADVRPFLWPGVGLVLAAGVIVAWRYWHVKWGRAKRGKDYV